MFEYADIYATLSCYVNVTKAIKETIEEAEEDRRNYINKLNFWKQHIGYAIKNTIIDDYGKYDDFISKYYENIKGLEEGVEKITKEIGMLEMLLRITTEYEEEGYVLTYKEE